MRRLRTFIRCSGQKLEHRRPNTWEAISATVARELEASFAGGPRTVVNPGEVEGPGLAARTGASIRGLFSRKPKPIPAPEAPEETEIEAHNRLGATARTEALVRFEREAEERSARHQREVEAVMREEEARRAPVEGEP
jgi:hypothetical protein